MRNRELFLFTGINGTGKTTTILKLASKIISKRKEKILYFMADYSENTQIKEFKTFNYTGIRKLYFTKENLILIAEKFKHGVIIFDDVRFMIPANIENLKPFYNLLIRRRQKDVDLFFSCHALTEVPPKLYTFINYITLFRTSDNIERYKKYILKYDDLKQLQKDVNQLSIKEPHYNKTLRLN